MAEWEEFGADRVGRYYLVGDEKSLHLTGSTSEWDGGSILFGGSPLGLLSQAEICQWLHPPPSDCANTYSINHKLF